MATAKTTPAAKTPRAPKATPAPAAAPATPPSPPEPPAPPEAAPAPPPAPDPAGTVPYGDVQPGAGEDSGHADAPAAGLAVVDAAAVGHITDGPAWVGVDLASEHDASVTVAFSKIRHLKDAQALPEAHSGADVQPVMAADDTSIVAFKDVDRRTMRVVVVDGEPFKQAVEGQDQ